MRRLRIFALAAAVVTILVPSTAVANPILVTPAAGAQLRTAALARPTFTWEMPEGQRPCQINVSSATDRSEDGTLLGDRTGYLGADATSWETDRVLPAGRWFWEVAGWTPDPESETPTAQANCIIEPQQASALRSMVVPYVLRGVKAGSTFRYGDQTATFTTTFFTTADNAKVSIVARHGRTVYFSGSSSGTSKAWSINRIPLVWDIVSDPIPCDQRYSTTITVKAGPRVQRLLSTGSYFGCA